MRKCSEYAESDQSSSEHDYDRFIVTDDELLQISKSARGTGSIYASSPSTDWLVPHVK